MTLTLGQLRLLLELDVELEPECDEELLLEWLLLCDDELKLDEELLERDDEDEIDEEELLVDGDDDES